jgi:hypothetical protein
MERTLAFVADRVDGQISFKANLLRILRESDNSSELIFGQDMPSLSFAR